MGADDFYWAASALKAKNSSETGSPFFGIAPIKGFKSSSVMRVMTCDALSFLWGIFLICPLLDKLLLFSSKMKWLTRILFAQRFWASIVSSALLITMNFYRFMAIGWQMENQLALFLSGVSYALEKETSPV